MTRRTMTGIALALGLMGSAAEAQDPGRAYKVAFWFDLDRPLATLRHQAYDLAKGEYDGAAVDRWLRAIREGHLGSAAFVRSLRTDGEPGATEAERLANAIDRERRRLIGTDRRPPRPFPSLVGPPAPRGGQARGGPGASHRPSPESSGGLPPNPPASPFPYPYRPRPL